MPKFIRGDVVRLNHDVETKGGRWFRAGVVMTIVSDYREYHLKVSVRGQSHYLRLTKVYGDRSLTLVRKFIPLDKR